MDYILSKNNLPSKDYNLTSLTCLILAAKYDELDRNIPSYDEFIRAASIGTTKEQVTNCEVKLLEYISWNLRIVTPLIFLQLLLTQGILYSTDKSSRVPINEKLIKQLTKQVHAILNTATDCKNVVLAFD